MRTFFKRLKALHQNRYERLYLYRKYKYDFYTKFFKKPRIELVCVNSDGVKYEIIARNIDQYVQFNGIKYEVKQYSVNQGFIWLENINGCLEINNFKYNLQKQVYRKITEDSTIIVSDRYEKADDNGEFFYEWILKNKPEYKKIYFALDKNSAHYKRLEQKGFKMLDFNSKEFYKHYKNADLLVSSVYAEYIENFKMLRYYKGAPKNRFICLQHGVEYRGADMPLNAQQKINNFVLSIELEKEMFSKSTIWFQEQQPIIGMSRIIAPVEEKPNNQVLFMPSWTQECFMSDNVEHSLLYKSIESFVKNQDTIEFLQNNDLSLRIVIHPQVCSQFNKWKKLEKGKIEILRGSEISYKEEISNCKLFITDTSSVVFDAMFKNKPVYFYHPDLRIIEDMGIDFTQISDVYSTPESLIAEMTKYMTTGESKKPNTKYLPKEMQTINERLWELIIDG